MATRVIHKTTLIIGTVLTTLFSLFILYGASYGNDGSPHLMAEAKYVEFLDTAATVTKANYENISTWEGEFNLQEDNYFYGQQCRLLQIDAKDPGSRSDSIRRSVCAWVKFAVDIQNDKLYTALTLPTVKHKALDLDREVATNAKYSAIRSIVTSDEYLSYEPNHIYAYDTEINGKWQPHSRAAFRRAVEEVTNEQWGHVRDPRKYFFQDQKATWEHLYVLRDILTGDVNNIVACHFDINIAEDKAGDRTKYNIHTRITTPTKKDKPIEIIMTLDSSAGFNLTTRRVLDSEGKTSQIMELTYEEVDGLYIPKTIHFVIYNPSEEKLFESRIMFTKSILNVPIPAETFTYGHLGLKEGDKFIDEIAGQEYIYKDGELIPASSGSSRGYPNVDGDHHTDMEELIALALRWVESDV